VRLDVYKDSLRNALRVESLRHLPSFDQMLSDVLTPAFNRLWAGGVPVQATLSEVRAPLQALVPRDLTEVRRRCGGAGRAAPTAPTAPSGIDLAEEMLAVARTKAAGLAAPPTLLPDPAAP
jgi:hypothetical protein